MHLPIYRLRALLPALSLAVALAATPPVRGVEVPALTNVDVVRMVMAGTPDEEIIERIRSTPVTFDVDPDILAELREAGLSEPVIRAMVARAAAQEATSPRAPGIEPVGTGTLEIRFDVDPVLDAAANSVVTPARARPLSFDEEGRLLRGEGEMQPVRLAFFTTCSDPSHVPDHWKSKSSIGRMLGRHHLVLFREATAPVAGQDKLVFLDHPGTWETELPAGMHRGHLGVAMQVGPEGEYIESFVAPYDALEIQAGKTSRLTVRLRSPEAARRGRRGFMRRAPPSGEAGADLPELGDPRLRPKVEVLSVGAPGGTEAPPPVG